MKRALEKTLKKKKDEIRGERKKRHGHLGFQGEKKGDQGVPKGNVPRESAGGKKEG